jgi:16S rRNA (uracil1498-N3)-methyltransferase
MGDTSIRLFVETPLRAETSVPVSEAQAHYLAKVMRLAAGDTLRVFNGVDGEWLARVGAMGKKSVSLLVQTATRPQVGEPDCWLCFALLKRQKTDLVVEKATELGASVIQPVITARTQGDHVNLDRLRAIAIEAAEQCERLAVPKILAPVKLPQLIATWPAGRALYMADERRTAKLARFTAAPAALLIGPEGGFTGEELEGIGAHPLVTRVSLGARILRAETAAIAGLAFLLAADPEGEEICRIQAMPT